MKKVESSIRQAKDQLPDAGFASFATKICVDDVNTIDLIEVVDQGQHTLFGTLEHVPAFCDDFLAKFCGKQSGAVDSHKVFKHTVVQMCAAATHAFDVDTAWFCLRSFLPSNEDMTRWHSDGLFFVSEPRAPDAHDLKVVVVLKGRTTKFARLSQEQRLDYFQHEHKVNRAYADKNQAEAKTQQKEVNKLVPLECEVTIPSAEQGVVFVTGNEQFSAIHSEPPFDLPRLFLSVVPGTAEQVASLKQRWAK